MTKIYKKTNVSTHLQVDRRTKRCDRRVENKSIFHLSHELVILAAFRRSSEVLEVNAVEQC